MLVNAQTVRRELAFVPPGEQRGRGLSWLSWTHLGAISDDGSKVLFSAIPRGEYYSYVRPTNGSPPVELGPGFGMALSRDGNWVLATQGNTKLVIMPVGPDVERTVNLHGVLPMTPRWLSDGRRIVLIGSTADQYHLFVVPAAGGTPVRLSDAGVRCCYFEVSRDDRFAAVRDMSDILTLYPLDGGAPIPLPELGKDAVAVGWDADGHLWVRSWRELPTRLRRYDIQERRTLEERTLSPDDTTGLVVVGQICITPDSRTMAFDYIRMLGALYQLDGLGPGGSVHAAR